MSTTRKEVTCDCVREGQCENCVDGCRVCDVYATLENLLTLIYESEKFERQLIDTGDKRLVELANQIRDTFAAVKENPLG